MSATLRYYRTVACVPWIWLALFYAFVVRARLSLGEWPAPYRPDPKVLGFHGHSLSVYLLFLVLPAAVLVWAVLTSGRMRRRESVWRPSLAFWLGLAGVVFAVTVDPGKFFEWFLD